MRQIAEITARLLDDLPARRQPPTTVPPLRRADVQARIAAREAHERAHELGLPHEHEDDDHVHEPRRSSGQRTSRGMPSGATAASARNRASARCSRMCSSRDHVGPLVRSMPHAHAMLTRPSSVVVDLTDRRVLGGRADLGVAHLGADGFDGVAHGLIDRRTGAS